MRQAGSILILIGGLLQAQYLTVSGSVAIARGSDVSPAKIDNSNAVVWLKPLASAEPKPSYAVRPRFKIVQHNRRFDPHVLAIPAGSAVDFPNRDPFFHNVFSMFDGKRFDLGLYESGASHSANFDTPGICYVFCNIHPEMSAVIVVLDSSYHAVSDRTGKVSIANVPPGRYLVYAWHERGKPDVPKSFPFEVTLSEENATLRTICLIDTGQLLPPHKNKYGRDYDTPKAPIYK